MNHAIIESFDNKIDDDDEKKLGGISCDKTIDNALNVNIKKH